MRIIFFGSSEFAVPVLEALKNKEGIDLVVTQPDRKSGRSQKISPTSVKAKADSLKIKTFQPENVNSKDSIEYLKKLKPDLFVVVSFGQILSKDLLKLPKLYPLNVHASLLPKYRGAAPINWAFANGERETGITIIEMNEKMDEGDIALKDRVQIVSNDDAVTLSKKLSKKGADLLLSAIYLIKQHEIKFTTQDNSEATYAPKLKKEDGLIDWRWSTEKICNRVRAFIPWPGCFTYLSGKILKIWKAGPAEVSEYKDARPATVLEISKTGILVRTGNGAIQIQELQLEGKRRMSAEEFIIGHKDLVPGVKL